MISVVLGGARSGKSSLAELRAAESSGPVTYFATGQFDQDPEFAERVLRHRARRPDAWTTVELPWRGDLVGGLQRCAGVALVDSLGTWLAGFPDFVVDHTSLSQCLLERRAAGRDTILVSDEVGLGVHPSTAVGRKFRDALGDLNRSVATIADEVVLVVA
ncbi:MAG: bifunctional adenosylcobinamide kinase/adenosylcobinamide-phosphate guanylyltransferase, partial [Acidimicrobiales bacterium]